MKLKKNTLIAILILVTALSLPAANMQKTYSRQSAEYQSVYALCISAGVLPPTSVTPATGAELAHALSRIEYTQLSASEKALYDSLRESLEYHPVLEYDLFGIDPAPTIGLDMFTQTAVPEDEYDLIFKRQDRQEGLNLDFSFKFADVGYGHVGWLILSPMITSYYDKKVDFNINKLLTGKAEDITATIHEGTLDAGILFGNDWMNFSIMSTRQEQGYGHTGNLVLGDNLTRQQYMRFHTFSRWFDYTYTMTRYSKMNYDGEALVLCGQDETFESPQQVFPLHRFDFKIADKVSISLVEGAMMLVDTPLDVRLLNPFLFIHGFNNYEDSTQIGSRGDEANNVLALEFGWTVAPHHRLNIQLLSDQIQLPGESSYIPMALGVLMNWETSWIADKAYITGWLEAAYTMPAVYLNNKTNSDHSYNPNYDFITGYQLWGYGNGKNGEIDYASYKYGPDAIVLALGLDAGQIGRFTLSTQIAYIIHGSYGLGYDYTKAARGEDAENPYNQKDVSALPLSVPVSDAEHRIEATLNASYTPVEGLTFNAGIGVLQAWNYKLEKGIDFFDLQLLIGLSFDPVRMFAK